MTHVSGQIVKESMSLVRVISFSTDQNIIENSMYFCRTTERLSVKIFFYRNRRAASENGNKTACVCVSKCEACVKYREKRSHIGYFTLGKRHDSSTLSKESKNRLLISKTWLLTVNTRKTSSDTILETRTRF